MALTVLNNFAYSDPFILNSKVLKAVLSVAHSNDAASTVLAVRMMCNFVIEESLRNEILEQGLLLTLSLAKYKDETTKLFQALSVYHKNDDKIVEILLRVGDTLMAILNGSSKVTQTLTDIVKDIAKTGVVNSSVDVVEPLVEVSNSGTEQDKNAAAVALALYVLFSSSATKNALQTDLQLRSQLLYLETSHIRNIGHDEKNKMTVSSLAKLVIRRLDKIS